MAKNISKNTILTNSITFKNGFGKVTGLINHNPQAIAFRTRFGIHTFLMKFPIDVIVLDKNRKVVFLKEKVNPNRIVFWNPKYNLILELPAGSIKRSSTTIGDFINLN